VLKVTFVHPDGRREAFPTVLGETVLDCALDHGVVGIKGQCGGACTCVTCHCYIEAPWSSITPAPLPDEQEMLEYACPRRATSRLACQVVITAALDGLVVLIPPPQ
jgi:ferredoxin, 2Fe-2S